MFPRLKQIRILFQEIREKQLCVEEMMEDKTEKSLEEMTNLLINMEQHGKKLHLLRAPPSKAQNPQLTPAV